jgi:peptidoglycan/xylan/chitin deacetylase (PgdA/CDA1 family)
MEKHGIRKEDALYFLPPFEWYNERIAEWCAEAGLALVNFTPGTLSNADYTVPEGEGRYVSSDSIFRSILSREANSSSGLRGFFLLTHIGSDPRRTDKFSTHLERLVTVLQERGYLFRRLGR